MGKTSDKSVTSIDFSHHVQRKTSHGLSDQLVIGGFFHPWCLTYVQESDTGYIKTYGFV